MEFRQLKYFVGVVEAGSFTKAATMLHVAQSALSLHVRQLEEEFGTQLLVRDRSGVTVTPSGAKLLERARTILTEIRITKAEMNSTAAAGKVTIGIPSGAARVLSAPLLEAVAKELPLVTLKMVEGMTGPLEEWMAAGRFNLAILYRTADAIAGLPILAKEDFYLVAPPNRPPSPDVVVLSDLHAFPLAVPMRTNNVRRSVSDAAAQHGCNLDVRFEVDSLSTIVSMVTEGKAYSILTPSAIYREARQGLVHMAKIVDPVITRSVVLAVNPKDENSPAVSAVRKLIPSIVLELIESGHWPAKAPAQVLNART